MDRSWIYLTLMVAVIGAVGATQCWECSYHDATGLVDKHCNSADDLRRVDIKNCTGSCFQANGTVALDTGLWVERGCMEDCKDSDDYDNNDITQNGIMRCCEGDFCNNEIFDGSVYGAADAPKASLVVAVMASLSAIFLYRTDL